VCDIGSGEDAHFLHSISEKIEKGIGIDRDGEEKKHGNIEIKRMELGQMLPIPDVSVDTVTMLAVLEHVQHHIEILKECRRILKPGGDILITVPTYVGKPLIEFLAYKLGLLDVKHIKDHKRYYNKKELMSDLEKAGFNVSDMKYWELGMNLFARARVL
jgi:ubiquinone/menaquinone biosynthesis C-methylase UbiE